MKATLRIIAALLLCALGLGLTSLAVSRFITPRLRPERDTGMPREKLRELAAIAPQVDVLVIGTSRMLHGFDPAVFEAETAKHGRALRAYNLSLQRLLLWEQAEVLDAALALPGCRPKVVVLEPAVGLGISPENFTHARTIEFETPAAWRLAAASVVGSDRAPAHKAWNLTAHTIVAGLHAANYGLYTDVVFPERVAAASPDATLVPEWRGFIPKKDPTPGEAAPEWLRAMAADYATRFPRDSADRGPLPEPMRAHFVALHARLAARGITVIYVQPPQLGFTSEELRVLTFRFSPALQGAGVPVVSFLNPAEHPALFEPRWWIDYNHMGTTGARRFTTELARELVQARVMAILK